MIDNKTFPIPLDLCCNEVSRLFGDYPLSPLRAKLQTMRFGLEQLNFEAMADASSAAVSPLTLSRYLSECIAGSFDRDACLKAVTPRIIAAIFVDNRCSLIWQFAEAALLQGWAGWPEQEKEAIRQFFNSLWCEQFKIGDIFALEGAVDAAPFGLSMKRIFQWCEAQGDAVVQQTIAILICRGMSQLQSRKPYWTAGTGGHSEAIEAIGESMTEWLLSSSVLARLEDAWLSESGRRGQEDPHILMALEFLYSVSDCS